MLPLPRPWPILSKRIPVAYIRIFSVPSQGIKEGVSDEYLDILRHSYLDCGRCSREDQPVEIRVRRWCRSQRPTFGHHSWTLELLNTSATMIQVSLVENIWRGGYDHMIFYQRTHAGNCVLCIHQDYASSLPFRTLVRNTVVFSDTIALWSWVLCVSPRYIYTDVYGREAEHQRRSMVLPYSFW